jgi:hypothetical protein
MMQYLAPACEKSHATRGSNASLSLSGGSRLKRITDLLEERVEEFASPGPVIALAP